MVRTMTVKMIMTTKKVGDMTVRLATIGLILLLLSACTALPSDDPYALRAQADAAIQATQRAAIQEARAATLEAASTKQAGEAEIALLNARLDATARALAYSETQSAATQQARDAQATQMTISDIGTQTAVARSATQTVVRLAVVAAQAKAERDQHTADFWANVLPVGIFILLIVCAVGGGIILWRAKDWLFVWRDRKNSIYNTTIGPVVVLPDGSFQLLQEIYHNRMRPQLDAGPSDVQWISQSVTSSPVKHDKPPDSLTDLAIRVVSLSVQQGDPGSDVILGHRELRMSSHTWQRGVGGLVDAGAAITEPGRGTYVGRQYQSCAQLLSDLQNGKLHLTPTPPLQMRVPEA